MPMKGGDEERSFKPNKWGILKMCPCRCLHTWCAGHLWALSPMTAKSYSVSLVSEDMIGRRRLQFGRFGG